ncbi:MAG: signal peptidase II [Planctomycetota bacterium]|jgi:signal peptidase II
MKAVPLNRYIVFSSIAIVGCAVDLWTKWYVFDRLGMPSESRSYTAWEGVLVFSTSLNPGALFGFGEGLPTAAMAFAVLSVVAALGILAWLFYFGAARDWILTVALGCVAAGILGNLYDRVRLHGLEWDYANEWHQVGDPAYAVRDWINIFPTVKVFFGRPWPTFNVADSLLVCGAVLLAWHAFGSTPKAQRQTPEDRDAKVEGQRRTAKV